MSNTIARQSHSGPEAGQGAGTLLTLVPTAGLLIGAPAKELWVL